MREEVRNITEELYMLDPSLREEQGVEEIVEQMLCTRPAVLIDRHFVVSLRERLVKRSVQSAPPVISPWNVWMLRLTPVAGLALLLIILVPDFFGTTSREPTERIPTPEMRTFDTMMAPKTTGPATAGEEGTSLMQLSATPAIDSFVVREQEAGDSVFVPEVTLSVPGFVVITELNGDDGEAENRILGVSAPLPIGTSVDVVVPLGTPTQGGETLVATLYRDDGNGRFVTARDEVVYDESGTNPISIVFSVRAKRSNGE